MSDFEYETTPAPPPSSHLEDETIFEDESVLESELFLRDEFYQSDEDDDFPSICNGEILRALRRCHSPKTKKILKSYSPKVVKWM